MAATNATVVTIEQAPPMIGRVVFEEPSMVVNESCIDVAPAVYHPAGYAVSLTWPPILGLAHIEVCATLQDSATGECQRLASSAVNVTTVPYLAGVYNLTLSVVSLGGHSASRSWPLHVDATPPIVGAVHIA
eukprot:5867439-Prymnesium_polylepis.1